VHRGILKSYNSVSEQILKDVEQLKIKYPSAGIDVSGHSMGAGMASFAAFDLIKKFGKINSLFSLATPRLGNEAFAKFVTY